MHPLYGYLFLCAFFILWALVIYKLVKGYKNVTKKENLMTLEEKIIKLKSALVELVGTKDIDELNDMKSAINTLYGVPDDEKMKTIKAIEVLIEILEDEK